MTSVLPIVCGSLLTYGLGIAVGQVLRVRHRYPDHAWSYLFVGAVVSVFLGCAVGLP